MAKRIDLNLAGLVDIPLEKIMQAAGTEAAELSMWCAMRAALHADATTHYSFYTLPAVTGCGVVALDESVTRA